MRFVFAAAEDLACFSISPNESKALAAAAEQLALRPLQVREVEKLTRLSVWESQGNQTLTEQVTAITDRIRNGGGLLLSLGKTPGYVPMRLSLLLPTTAWQSSVAANRRDGITIAECDLEFFGDKLNDRVHLPFYYEIRPFHAAERGQSRCDRFLRPVPYIQYTNPRRN